MRTRLGEGVTLDVDQLIKSRMLIQANSGGGKSYAIRKLCEISYGVAQQIIIDVEGEFASLREQFDYVLAGPGGDCQTDLRSAALLARRLLELNVSAIIDISELGVNRARYVRLFLEALINVPKVLWHPALVVLDEAHLFAPEKTRAESLPAVVDLMTRGRKRGFAGVLATQRISKLSKDASAECNNKLIGRCVEGLDRKRAAEELGFTVAEDVRNLRLLQPGEFYAFGPAMIDDVTKTKIGRVRTAHEDGDHTAPPPPPRDRVKKILAQLADLPHEAEEELKTVAELRARVKQLEREAKARPVEKTPAPIKEAVAIINPRQLARVELLVEKMLTSQDKLAQAQQAVISEADNLRQMAKQQMAKTLPAQAPLPLPLPLQKKIAFTSYDDVIKAVTELTGPQRKVLGALAWFEVIGIKEPTSVAVAFMADYKGENGAFNNARGSLRSMGLVEYPHAGAITLTDAGRGAAPPVTAPPTGDALRQAVLARLEGPHQRVLQPLLSAWPNEIPAAELAVAAGYNGENGAFNNARGRLRTLGLVIYPRVGVVRAADILFPDN